MGKVFGPVSAMDGEGSEIILFTVKLVGRHCDVAELFR